MCKGLKGQGASIFQSSRFQLTGKHYNRVIIVHKVVAEGLERLLLMKFEETRDGRIKGSNLSEAGT